ncbi:MAG: type 4a pilus biogenesis protein PilO [Candidatus Omnitrophica bacterium]|nr:type 4a pilus biogenesis protein PilO [Candidatus Omnitrophota bacterium]MCM8826549.1 type 4a pilus biogenesis protein PilO [Candidatus Omnitrophota bacterium]
MKDLLKYINIIIALLIILVFGFIAEKIYSYYSFKDSQLKNKDKEIQEKQDLRTKIEEMDIEFNRLENNLIKEDTFGFKVLLDNIGERASVTIDSFRPLGLKDYDVYREIRVEIGVNSDYRGLSKFINLLESTGAIEVESLVKTGGTNCRIYILVLLKK